jgi:hypothetical protein
VLVLCERDCCTESVRGAGSIIEVYACAAITVDQETMKTMIEMQEVMVLHNTVTFRRTLKQEAEQ